MSAGPREYHLNFEAAQELQQQSENAKAILERLAAHLAATQPGRDIKDLVEREHVIRAAELLFQSASASGQVASEAHCVFISFSHEDAAFVAELAQKLDEAGIACFQADRDIQIAADWAESIWTAIRQCRVFLSVLTPRFMQSRWRDLEAGAAYAAGKKVVAALRYVERDADLAPFDRFLSIVVESDAEVVALVDRLHELCAE